MARLANKPMVERFSSTASDTRRQRGGASLIVTMILAITLLGIVASISTLSLKELRQASNTEQSAKALLAAQSYVDTVANKISDGVSTGLDSSCSSTKIGDSFITCASQSQGSATELTGVLKRDQSFSVRLTGRDVKYVKLQWGSGDYSSILPNTSLTSFPSLGQGDNWDYQAAPEVTTVAWNKNASTGKIVPTYSSDGAYGLPINKFVIKPGVSSGSPASVCTLVSMPRCTTKASGTDPGYSIGAVADDLVYKITARYNDMNYKLTFYNSLPLPISVSLPYVTIDVTAKNNNLYRRVIAQKTLIPTQTFGFLDGNVLFSGDNICKNLKVGDNNVPVNGGDGKNTSSCE